MNTDLSLRGRRGDRSNLSLKNGTPTSYLLKNRLLQTSFGPLRNDILILVILGLLMSSQPLFAEPHAFPVPFVAKQHANITFTDLPGSGSIKIFTIDGEEVANLSIAPGELIKQWNVTSSTGKKLASGVYLYLIDGNDARIEGKLVVIR